MTDKQIVKELAQKKSEIANLPQQETNKQHWIKINSLRRVKPPVRITEVPWNEMNIDQELTNLCQDPWYRDIETALRRTLFQWEYFPANHVVDCNFPCPIFVEDDGFGYEHIHKKIATEEENVVWAYEYPQQIETEADVKLIRKTNVTVDWQRTEVEYQRLQEVFGDILTINYQGPSVRLFPWDHLIEWMGIESGLAMMATEPDLVHEAIDRLIGAHIDRLQQYEKLGVLTLNTGNHEVGSGGFGFTDELPSTDFDPEHIKLKDMWGSSAAQIFSCVSPEMHEEFAFRYEARLLELFGLSYYGCCDPLHLKIDMLSKLKNLRKVSMSPWIDIEHATEQVGNRYVFSYKPDPAFFAQADWSLERAEKELDTVCINAKKNDCRLEIIMKNISTTMHKPQRLIEWAQMAESIIDKHY